MTARSLVLGALLLSLVGAADAQQLVTFARGTAEVVLPDTFVTTELNDGSLRALFGSSLDHRLELTAREAYSPSGEVNPGEVFVRAQAERKQAKLFGLQDKVVYMEPLPDAKIGDKAMRAVRWQIGFGSYVVVMTLTAPVEVSAELAGFLAQPLNDIIKSLRRKRVS